MPRGPLFGSRLRALTKLQLTFDYPGNHVWQEGLMSLSEQSDNGPEIRSSLRTGAAELQLPDSPGDRWAICRNT